MMRASVWLTPSTPAARHPRRLPQAAGRVAGATATSSAWTRTFSPAARATHRLRGDGAHCSGWPPVPGPEGVVIPPRPAGRTSGLGRPVAGTAKDERGNVAQGDAMLHECQDTWCWPTVGWWPASGVQDLVVIETPDAVLVAHQGSHPGREEDRRRTAPRRAAARADHRKVFRPWGWYDGVDAGERFQVKRIAVKPGGQLSLQMHHHPGRTLDRRARHRAGHLRRQDFPGLGEPVDLHPAGVQHRLENPGLVDLEMIEVQSGSYLGEDDIVRFEDVYGR